MTLKHLLMTGVLLTAVLGVASAAPAHASVTFMTGNDLLQMCRSSASFVESGECLGFVAGIADAMESAQAAGGSLAGWRACRSLPVTRGQVQDVAVQFLTRHPELRHHTAVSLVAKALEEAFPCRGMTSQR